MLKWGIEYGLAMTPMSAEQKMTTCLNLLSRGGGRVSVQYGGEFDEFKPSLNEDWIVDHYEGLNMLTLDLPSHGVLCMMHPAVLNFEEERHDFHPLEEQE